MMTLFPLAGPDDQSGRVQTSIERFARNDLVSRFFDFKRVERKNQHSHSSAANALERNNKLAFGVKNSIDGHEILRHFHSVMKRR